MTTNLSPRRPCSPPPPSNRPDPKSTSLLIFPPTEESALLQESNQQKASANALFTSGSYPPAIQIYEKALSACPGYLEYEIAVLHSNIAACHLKLLAWKEATESATKSLEALDRIAPSPSPVSDATPGEDKDKEADEQSIENAVQEVDEQTEIRIEALARTGRTLQDVQKLRTKALLRRAKARMETGGWAALQGALEDYTVLDKTGGLTELDRRAVRAALQELPGKLETAKSAEMTEMMGKLKKLGNGILKPFGLSTDNFNFVKDEKSGGYSMQFNQ